jgi:hypothetical protein
VAVAVVAHLAARAVWAVLALRAKVLALRAKVTVAEPPPQPVEQVVVVVQVDLVVEVPQVVLEA